ncbi:hypothetical protein ACFLQ7_00885 [Actinomycetota bacterium]
MRRLVLTALIASALMAWGLPLAVGANGGADVYTDQTLFAADTSATAISFPGDADGALPSTPFPVNLTGYSCDKPSISLAGGDVTITNPSSNWICYIDEDWNAGLANTNPTPTAPTIVNNGEDDFTLAFSFTTPVHAVGIGLLTNVTATETVTLQYLGGTTEVVGDAVLGTASNSFEFIGFRSNKPIVGLVLDTTGGAVQNEGITGLWTSPFYLPPTLACPDGQVFVSAEGVGANTPLVSVSAVANYPYAIDVMGTYFAGGANLYDIQADAKYSEDSFQRANALPWTDLVRNYESYGPGLLELMVDGGYVDWGAFSADHMYSIEYMATGDLEFQIYDIYAQNNTGGLCVDVDAIAKRSINGGGQIIADSDNPKKPYKVSFGGYIDDIDGGLVCEWQVNLHNVEGTDLDKSKFHASTCTAMNTWPSGTGGADGVANFTAQGTFNGEPGYTAIFRVEDYTEPSVMDTFRVTITGPGDFVFDTYAGAGGVFPGDSNNIGQARTLLDNGNIQISFYE